MLAAKGTSLCLGNIAPRQCRRGPARVQAAFGEDVRKFFDGLAFENWAPRSSRTWRLPPTQRRAVQTGAGTTFVLLICTSAHRPATVLNRLILVPVVLSFVLSASGVMAGHQEALGLHLHGKRSVLQGVDGLFVHAVALRACRREQGSGG